MKKLICFLSLSLVLVSCSGDDNAIESNTEGSILTRTVAMTNGGEIVESETFEYSGTKLYKKTVTFVPGYFIYEYTGDLITKVSNFRNNVLVGTEFYTYNDNGDMIESNYRSNNADIGHRTTCVYNSDQTITVTTYSGTLEEQNRVQFRRKVYLQNGTVTKLEEYSPDTNVLTMILEFTYDDKNAPYNNIPGYTKIKKFEFNLIGETNNITKYHYASAANPAQALERVGVYEYNGSNFPVKATFSTPPQLVNQPSVLNFYYR